MLNNENLFIQTKDEIEKLWSNNKKLSNFVIWPKNLVLKKKTINKINVLLLYTSPSTRDGILTRMPSSA